MRIHALFLLMAAGFWALAFLRAGAAGAWHAALLLATACVCLFLHELAHAWVAQALGIPVRAVILGPLINFTLLEREPQGPRAELLVAAAGPAANIVLFMVFSALSASLSALPQTSTTALEWTATMRQLNLWMALGNLIPVLPADGGRMLRAFLGQRHPFLVATRIVSRIGTLCIVLCVAVAALWTPLRTNVFALLLLLLIALHLHRANQGAIQQALVRELRIHLNRADLVVPSVLRANLTPLTVEAGGYRTLQPAQFEKWQPLCECAAHRYLARLGRRPAPAIEERGEVS